MADSEWKELKDPDEKTIWKRLRDGAMFTVQEDPVDPEKFACGAMVAGVGAVDLTSQDTLEEMQQVADEFDLDALRS